MLVLSRKPGETLCIDGYITVKVVKISGNRVKLGIEAPDKVHVLRGEVGDWREHDLGAHGSPVDNSAEFDLKLNDGTLSLASKAS